MRPDAEFIDAAADNPQTQHDLEGSKRDLGEVVRHDDHAATLHKSHHRRRRARKFASWKSRRRFRGHIEIAPLSAGYEASQGLSRSGHGDASIPIYSSICARRGSHCGGSNADRCRIFPGL